jgi:hypothetical protein
MPKDECSGDNVAGRIAADLETDGHLLDDTGLEALGDSGKANYFEQTHLKDAEAFDMSQQTYGDETDQLHADADAITVENWGSKDWAKQLVFSLRDPSGVLGYDIVQPIVDFEHAHKDDAKGYFAGIREVMDTATASAEGLSDSRKAYFSRYAKYQRDGGSFHKSGEAATNIFAAAGTKLTSNVTQNIIMSSKNVILGNLAESAMKLPSHYPTTFFPAFVETLLTNPWKQHPDRVEQGIYGYFGEEAKSGQWHGLMGVTDVPFKNITYLAGEMAHGDGARAVQEIAFASRPGNIPEAYRTPTGRAMLSLTSFTIGQYKMIGNMLNEAWHGHPQKLIIYAFMASLIGGADNVVRNMIQHPGDKTDLEAFGGGAAAGVIGIMPGLEALMSVVDPDGLGTWLNENNGYLSRVYQTGLPSGLGASWDIANRTVKQISSNFNKAAIHWQDGEYMDAVGDIGNLTSEGVLPFTQGVGSGVVKLGTGMWADYGIRKSAEWAWKAYEENDGDIPGYFMDSLQD